MATANTSIAPLGLTSPDPELTIDDNTPLFAVGASMGLSPLSPAEAKTFSHAHGINPYIPLPMFRNQPGTPVIDPLESENTLVAQLSTVVNQTLDITKDLSPLPEKTICAACLTVIHDSRHLQQDCHKLAMSAQIFRLCPINGRKKEYQQWLYAYRAGTEHLTTHGAKVILQPKSTPLQYGGLVRFKVRPLWNDTQPIPLVFGRAPLGDLELSFTLTYKMPPKSVARAIMTTADKHGYTKEESIKLISFCGQRDFVVRFRELEPGYGYYSIHLWLELVIDRCKQLFPLVCEVSVERFSPRFNLELVALKEKIHPKRQIFRQEFRLSKVPESIFKSHSQGQGNIPTVYRVLDPIGFDHAGLIPYVACWTTGEAESIKRSNREVTFGSRTNDDDLPLETQLSFHSPVSISNFGYKNLAEVVGQMQLEEDEPPQAPLLYSWLPASELLNEMELAITSDIVYLAAEMLENDFRQLRLHNSEIRLVHPDWRAKFMGCVVKQRQNVSGEMGAVLAVIIQLNAGVKKLLPAWVEEDPCQIVMIPCAGLSTMYLMGIYYRFLHDEIPLTGTSSSQGEVVETLVEGMDNNWLPSPEGRQDDQMEIDAGSNNSVSSQLTDNVTAKPSRRVRLLTHLRRNFDEFFEPLFADSPESRQTLYPVNPYNFPDEVLNFFSSLDQYQYQLVTALGAGHKVIGCHAPPGTGKTSTLAALACGLVHTFPQKKILCVAPTNAAANVLTLKLVEAFKTFNNIDPPTTAIFRYVRHEYPVHELDPVILPYCTSFVGHQASIRKVPIADQLHLCSVIICTVDLALMDMVNTLDVYQETPSSGVVLPIIDYLFVDEAASLDLPRMSLVLPLAIKGQVLMVGDTDQLPAYITNQLVKNVAGDESTMEFVARLINQNGPNCYFQLQNNYRSRQEIIQPSNQEIYCSRPLKTVFHQKLTKQFHDDDQHCFRKLTELLFQSTTPQGLGLAFSHIEGRQVKHGTSWYNAEELYEVGRIVEIMTRECSISTKDIGIDTTYAAQATYLKAMLEAYPSGLRIGCSNTWQGNERPYMILCLVRAVPSLDAFGTQRAYGFLADLRRLNVSLTRARKGNIIVGNAVRFARHPLIRECLRIFCSASAWIQPINHAVALFVHYTVCEAVPEGNAAARRLNGENITLKQKLENPNEFRCITHSLSKPHGTIVNHN